MSDRIVPVVLGGGGGTRLWPLSTADRPKQFLQLRGKQTLFEQALSRVADTERFHPPIVVAGIANANDCQQALRGSGSGARLILEPCARNTAPAITVAAVAVRTLYGPEAVMLVTPSDHLIEDPAEFDRAIAAGLRAASDGRIITFGIRPTAPESGYGYIETGAPLDAAPGVHSVEKFVEKPAREAAEAMVASGNYLWNAGIFMFQAGVILSEMERLAPETLQCAAAAFEASERDGIRVGLGKAEFADCPSDAIDYAVMEKSDLVAVVPMEPGWSDLGSWDALASLPAEVPISGPVTALDCENCYIRSEGIEIAALGLRDLIVVAAGDRLLILPKGRSQEVKALLATMDSTPAKS